MGSFSDDSDLKKMINYNEKVVKIDDINQMGIIINDNDCSDSFIDEVCNELANYGVNFRIAKKANEINYDNAVVVTLDQQYSSGADSVIFAPYNNARLGSSDSLALSMKSSFEDNGYTIKDILCGQVGYIMDDKGNVSTTKPTSTEVAIDENNAASFVTISLGTTNISAEKVAKSIVEGLARYRCYLENYDENSDLIYRASSNDSIEDVARYFGIDFDELKKFNNIKNESFIDSQTVINPCVANIDAFQGGFKINVAKELSRHY